MNRDFSNLGSRQDGAILIISLVILIAITLLTISSMRSSNIGLRMAQNEESRVAAAQGAQALDDHPAGADAGTPRLPRPLSPRDTLGGPPRGASNRRLTLA